MMPKTRVRECGDCIVCCVYLRVDELQKPSLTHCRHLNLSLPVQENTCQYSSEEKIKCREYAARPKSCRDYHCLWRLGFGAEEDRPDRCGVLIDTVRGVENCIEVKPIGPNSENSASAWAAISRMCAQRQCPAIVTGFYEQRLTKVIGLPPEKGTT